MIPRPLTLAWLTVLLVISLGLLGWSLFPDNASNWALVVIALPALWAFLEAAHAGRSGQDNDGIIEWHRTVIVWVGLVVIVSIGFQLAIATNLIGAEWAATARRVRGVMFGIGLGIWGNYLPKLVSPWSLDSEPFDWQRVHRFAGWLATLCGAALVLVWLTLPIETARPASIAITLAFVVPTLGRKLMSIAAYSRG